jgi:hypothetical protein
MRHCTAASRALTVSGLAAFAAFLISTARLAAHDPSSVPITWNREVSRIVFDRCASCHRPEGTAFSLMTFQDAQPRAVAIKESVASRRMPPWGAVKGFGNFRNDFGLTQEQITLITEWVEGGISKGNNPRALPPPPTFKPPLKSPMPSNGVQVRGELTLDSSLRLDALLPGHVPPHTSVQITAALPDGTVEPLLWLYEYEDRFQHPFLLRRSLSLPAGTVIRGVPKDASVMLIPASSRKH